jgi:hypothetical protein
MLNVPLAVRLTSTTGDKHITRRLRDLSFRSIIPGGYASAALSFDQPLATTDPAVEMYGKVYIYDGRSGATVWEGRQEDPGRGASADGQVWTLNAFGPSVHTEDRKITVCYADNGTEAWQQSPFGNQNRQVSSVDDDPPTVQVQAPNGTILAAGDNVQAINRIIADCGQKIARLSVVWDSGVTDGSCSVRIITRNTLAGTGAGHTTGTLNTAGGTYTVQITADITGGDDIASFCIARTGATGTIVDDVHWITGQLVIQGTRYNQSGTEVTAAASYTTDTVLASQVVADLLGRCLNLYDGTNASVATTAFAIDRLVYPDPTSPSQILDDLMALESSYYWAAWESTATGQARFEWSAWPTTVRYETSITGDFNSPGDVGDLYNAVLVRYRDRNGRSRTVRRTRAQADLDAAGITREGETDLGDNIGSKANAQRAGDRFLLEHSSPPNAGTLNISTPVLDVISGRLVQPWELLPGNLVRVRGVLPRVDALNATDRDAITVFRMHSTDYTASTNTCQVGLDSYARTLGNQIVDAHKRIDKLRKR